MYDVADDNTGLLYFSSFNNELITFNPFSIEEKKLSLPETGKTAPLFIRRNWVLSDTTRNLIYFTNNDNFYQYNTINKTFRKLYVDSSYYVNQSKHFEHSYMLDKGGFIWLSTPDFYLWKINPDKFKIVDTVKFTNTHIDLNDARLYGCYNEYLLISTLNSQLLFNTKNYQCVYLNRNNGLMQNQCYWHMMCNGKAFFTYAGTGITQVASIDKLLQSPQKITPYITFILVNNKPVVLDTLPQYLKNLRLDYTHNTISIAFSAISTEFPERLEYAYKLEETDNEWIYTNNLNRRINYANLAPGKYIFKVKVREWGLDWSPETNLFITITPPFWRTWWFITLCVLASAALIFWFAQWRINNIRRQEQLRAKHEKELLELEAKALRAQMNPHFIFNCMNSIKALIQQNEPTKAVNYLTTFSKLIRTIFNNSDKREISLFDELETCKLYTQLEAMRFENKLKYEFAIDDSIDLKSINVPALILQPFIENAIWHGIMPMTEGGKVSVTVKQENENIICTVEDDGIGREVSLQNKMQTLPHQSKGVRLTQQRLTLENSLNERGALLTIVDKKSDDGKPAGTIINITLKAYAA
jgi:hypothetical protein